MHVSVCVRIAHTNCIIYIISYCVFLVFLPPLPLRPSPAGLDAR